MICGRAGAGWRKGTGPSHMLSPPGHRLGESETILAEEIADPCDPHDRVHPVVRDAPAAVRDVVVAGSDVDCRMLGDENDKAGATLEEKVRVAVASTRSNASAEHAAAGLQIRADHVGPDEEPAHQESGAVDVSRRL